MSETRVSIDPQAVLNAVNAENEWRKNRMLLLENEVVKLNRRIAELEEAKPKKETK